MQRRLDPARASAGGLIGLTLMVAGACSSDLFHSTNWQSVCDDDPTACAEGGAGGGGGSSTAARSSASEAQASSAATGGSDSGGSNAGGANSGGSGPGGSGTGGAPTCPNGTCDPGETCTSCPSDCTCACMPDQFEPNEKSLDAKPVSSGTMYCNLSICDNDIDWLSFNINSGFTATITFSNAQGDLDLEIYGGANVAYVSGSYGHGNSETVTKSGLAAGKYYARIYGLGVTPTCLTCGDTNPAYCFKVTTM